VSFTKSDALTLVSNRWQWLVMIENPMVLLQRSLAAPPKLVLNVSHARHAERKRVELETPFAVIGRGKGADIPLKGSAISFRHAYIQPLMGNLFCVDLGSKSGLQWGKKRRSSGWLSDGASLTVGPYNIAPVVDDRVEANDDSSISRCENPLQPLNGGLDEYPRFQLTITDVRA
jgi:hypothetical protein